MTSSASNPGQGRYDVLSNASRPGQLPHNPVQDRLHALLSDILHLFHPVNLNLALDYTQHPWHVCWLHDSQRKRSLCINTETV